MSLGQEITLALNNPECNVLSGMILGELFAIQGVMYMLIIYAVFKLIDKLALDPLINWVKSKYNNIIVIKKKKDTI